jgi:hypothetical protein
MSSEIEQVMHFNLELALSGRPNCFSLPPDTTKSQGYVIDYLLLLSFTVQ